MGLNRAAKTATAACAEARPAANLLSFAQDGPVISRRSLGLVGCGLVAMGALWAFQKPFRVYPSMEAYDDIPLPPDWQEKAEWVQARLMYPQHPEARFARSIGGLIKRISICKGGYSFRRGAPSTAHRHSGGSSWALVQTTATFESCTFPKGRSQGGLLLMQKNQHRPFA